MLSSSNNANYNHVHPNVINDNHNNFNDDKILRLIINNKICIKFRLITSDNDNQHNN